MVGVEREFKRRPVFDMNVGEDVSNTVLGHVFSFDFVHQVFIVKNSRHRLEMVREHVDVYIGSLPDMTGENATNQAR